jgi:hypothetical protein
MVFIIFVISLIYLGKCQMFHTFLNDHSLSSKIWNDHQNVQAGAAALQFYLSMLYLVDLIQVRMHFFLSVNK